MAQQALAEIEQAEKKSRDEWSLAIVWIRTLDNFNRDGVEYTCFALIYSQYRSRASHIPDYPRNLIQE